MKIASLLRKKWLLAAVAAAVVGSAAYAFAATLGVSSSSLGAGNTTVSSCTSSVSASYANAYDSSLTNSNGGQFAVSSVSLKFAPSTTCAAGDKIEVVLIGSSNASLGNFVYTVGAADGSSGDLSGTTLTVANDGTLSGTAHGVGADGTASYASGDGVSFLAANGASGIAAADVTGIAVSAVGAAS
jgi:hypothetical protein